GGGGGATGGGGGAASPTARNSGAGGGGGSSTGPADATFVTGSRLGNGGAVLQWGPCSAQPGLVKVEKTDEKTGKPLTGAVFQLWRETNGIDGLQVVGRDPDTRVGSARATDERGRCEFSGLAPGTFYLEETAVPEGYELPDNPVIGPYELTERDPVLAASVSNSRA
ncbi:prealbumin-like fold domain-containing protein, partial [Streptomyces sp. NPDC057499]|uniref:prealbumin-like fold domain-containing protein n=1 Tax=Streptomyces sp. NPDC057499 TaxID=3346150 RepID=UPI0036A799D6